MQDPPDEVARSRLRHYVAVVLIGSVTALSLGLTLKTPTLLGGNDISRWCTVWALLERGTYAIDDCPWRERTKDKVYRPTPFQRTTAGQEPVKHFYSSKPPLLPTLIAGLLYPWRQTLGVPLEQVSSSGRTQWPAYVLYFKPMIVLLNIVPFLLFLIGYKRLLDRSEIDDWAWLLSLTAAALGTPLVAFNAVLTNHTIAAYCAFFALEARLRIDRERGRSGLLFASSGFFSAFCACNELPAASFGILLFLGLLRKSPRTTLCWFVPAAAIPCALFLATQYLAMGTVVPVYAEFGSASYLYPGSYWQSPSGIDALEESRVEYLYNMLIGHHGVLSLMPIFLFSVLGAMRLWRGPQPMASLARLTVILTLLTVVFYLLKTNNYGGSTQGLRWLFWLIPFWLILLPSGLEPGCDDPVQRWFSLATLLASVFSVGYALSRPWSHPWLLDLLVQLGLYDLPP